MKPIPEFMKLPAAVSAIEHYRDQYIKRMAHAGMAAEKLDAASVTATLLAAGFGMLDACLCSFIAYHTSEGASFDADQFCEMVKSRVSACEAIVERESCMGGVQ